MNEDLISVVIPVYNVEPYIAQCLDSVVEQTHKNTEIICVNDRGSDNSMTIVREYAHRDNRVKIVSHDVNKGLGIARNTGMAAASGDYLFFLDSDDYITGSILEKLLDTVKKTQSDVVISKTVTFLEDENDRWLIERQRAVDSYLDFSAREGYACADIADAISNVSSVAWGKLYSLDFLKSNGITFANANIIHEDDGFNIKLLSNKPVVTWIKDIGIMYRLRKSSITGKIEQAAQRRKKLRNMRTSLEDAFSYIHKHLPKSNAMRVVQDIKCHNLYNYCFEKKLNILGLLKISWSPRLKRIKLFGINVFEKVKAPKISVIVPFYNTVKNLGTEQYLRQNIESLIAQSYDDYEIIYVDNNSDDSSRAIIESYNNPQIRLVSEPTPGVANARNAGIDNAAGDYFTFVDSDDFVAKNYLRKAANALKKLPDILIGNFTMCKGGKMDIATYRYRAIRKYGESIKDSYGSMECPHNIFFKLSFINKHNIRQTDGIFVGEDNLFNISAILNTDNVKFYKSFGYYYQMLETSSSNVKSDKYMTFIDAYDRIFTMAKEKYGYINEYATQYFNAKCKDFDALVLSQDLFRRKASELCEKYKDQSTSIPSTK